MDATCEIRSPIRELAHREGDGLEIVLFWHESTDDLAVGVSDTRSGAYFELAAAPDEALEVFNHPYAYAAFQGVPYDEALLASWAQAAGSPSGRNATNPYPEPVA